MAETFLYRTIVGEVPPWSLHSEVSENVHKAGSEFIDDLATSCTRPGGCTNSSESEMNGSRFKVIVACEIGASTCFLQSLEPTQVAEKFDETLRRVEYGEDGSA